MLPIADIFKAYKSVVMDAVPFGLLVWSTGLAPNPLIQSIQSVQKHEKTQRLVFYFLRGAFTNRLFLAF